MNQKTKSWLIALAMGIAYALLIKVLFDFHPLDYLPGVMSLVFFVNFYASWLAGWIMKDIQNNILQAIQTRSEGKL